MEEDEEEEEDVAVLALKQLCSTGSQATAMDGWRVARVSASS